MGNHSCDRPRGGCMFRRERRATLKERAGAVALVRTLSTQRILKSLDCDQTVQSSLACEETRFTPAFVVSRKAQEIESRATANESGNAVVRNALVMLESRGILIKRRAVLAIC